jgi:hypothetical protein
VLDEHPDIQALQQHGIHVPEIGSEDPGGLGMQELPAAKSDPRRGARPRPAACTISQTVDGATAMPSAFSGADERPTRTSRPQSRTKIRKSRRRDTVIIMPHGHTLAIAPGHKDSPTFGIRPLRNPHCPTGCETGHFGPPATLKEIAMMASEYLNTVDSLLGLADEHADPEHAASYRIEAQVKAIEAVAAAIDRLAAAVEASH